MYIEYFFFALSLVLLTLPKKIEKKDLIFAAIKFLVIYIVYVFGESLFFALANLAGMPLGGVLFSVSFAIIPIIYLSIFIKGEILHKIVKNMIIVASFLIIAEISRTFGSIVGAAVDTGEPGQGINPFVVLARSLPYIAVPFISFIIYKYNISRFKHLPLMHVIMILVLATLLCASAVWQNYLNVDRVGGQWLLIFVSSIELFVLVGLYYSIYALIDYRHKVTELEVQSSLLTVEKESLMIDEKNREELMKIRHDLQNQLSYTQALLNDGKYEEANKYIQSLINQKEEYIYSFSCSNLVISGIVNLELTKAKIADKKIKFKAVVPPKLPFEDSDLLSLITNIVDNSLENFVPQDDKDMINVSIVTQQDYLRITAFNSVDQKAIKDKPSLRTTKRGKAHGYGTKIIKNIVNKYEGHVSFAFEDSKFVCDCLIDMSKGNNNNA